MLQGFLFADLLGKSGRIFVVECAACSGPGSDGQVFAFPIGIHIRSATLAQSLYLLKLIVEALLLDLHEIGAD